MKKINRYEILVPVLALLLFTGLLGCENFLDPEPRRNVVTEEEVYSDILQAERVLSNIYSGIRSGLSSGSYHYCMLGSVTDEGINAYNWAGSWSINSGAWSPSNTFDSAWSGHYASLRKIHLFLQNIEQTPGDQALINRMKAEARFMRAYYYFALFKRYGGVPLITKVINVQDDLDIPRASAGEVVDFIAAEVDTVSNRLPEQYGPSDLGRATKGAALALKARTLLYWASPLHNPSNETGRWQAAADAAKEVIDLGIYELYPDYRQLFLEPFNREIIFAKPDYGNTFFGTMNLNNRLGWGGTNPLVNLIEDYDMANGKSIEDPTSGFDEDKPMENRDPRLYQTVVVPGTEWQGYIYEPWGVDGRDSEAGGGGDGTRTGFNLKKFLYEPDRENLQPNSRTWPIFRLGEMYLNHAEALNEAQGPVSEVCEALNEVRGRETVELPPLNCGAYTKEKMRERIHKERRIELAFEEHRWFDVMRWKKGEEFAGDMYGYDVTLNEDSSITYEKQVIQTRRYDTPEFYRYPIPQSEMNINPELEQNPGW
ncbi:RagB/SusD family nutrient uptake outer membrane protein [Fodinibius salsisoli]|uniref:RagB/SusD family nutrient uptake outer membrane protein n=1 Tax=Fodinibius salsisoli TaxID=2820877 RepID=A0ABT3PQ44_9BACT|nr:RagB/SusD family nutrient uptake outer membrane protein [Fodinibius salsisoli]MCW9707977.1 RagB/SusD family nutrient uptake outer membrane protein [Fodinibius salsisoli]